MPLRIRQFVLRLWEAIVRRPWLAILLALIGMGLYVVAELADELHERELLPYDLLIMQWLSPYQSPALEKMSLVLSDLLVFPDVLFLIVPMLVYLWFARHYFAGFALATVPTLTWFLIDLLKHLFDRARPLGGLIVEVGRSFPSGHAGGAVVIYGLLGYCCWRYLARTHRQRLLIVILVILLIFATGFARVYLHVHYPSDVAAGWATGACMLFATLALLETAERAEHGVR